MAPLKKECRADFSMLEAFNNFQYWREPVQEISLPGLDEDKEVPILKSFESFLYWREPILEIDDLQFYD